MERKFNEIVNLNSHFCISIIIQHAQGYNRQQWIEGNVRGSSHTTWTNNIVEWTGAGIVERQRKLGSEMLENHCSRPPKALDDLCRSVYSHPQCFISHLKGPCIRRHILLLCPLPFVLVEPMEGVTTSMQHPQLLYKLFIFTCRHVSMTINASHVHSALYKSAG